MQQKSVFFNYLLQFLHFYKVLALLRGLYYADHAIQWRFQLVRHTLQYFVFILIQHLQNLDSLLLRNVVHYDNKLVLADLHNFNVKINLTAVIIMLFYGRLHSAV